MASIEQRLRAYYDEEMAQRAERPLGAERESRLAAFVQHCHEAGLTSVVEIGCGAGRDGKVLAASGLAYRGLDLSTAAVELCRGLGLDAVVGSATELPYDTDEFDAGWSMSTLMHLPGDGLAVALSELRRVIRPGGVLEVGLWGADESCEWTDPDGRYFRSRNDEELRRLLSAVGRVTEFDTWSRFEDGGHYQWARTVVE
ncbi:class I SAM-dependent methyltransferase [Humibacillus xanthopallidus]|uniref:Methyltransferase family protein n=1 Tax=Humibacillus xanthopallidus TaxID=412689 RepID=A0A543HGH6_9MICO|nr:class I SAM-dependent methyltransferase [Humibacillus xanthopallidus]TQM57393.1 methyltransferase family protein [Humibacillus xanthopallidus]